MKLPKPVPINPEPTEPSDSEAKENPIKNIKWALHSNNSMCDFWVWFNSNGDSSYRNLYYLVSQYGYTMFDGAHLGPNFYKFTVSPFSLDYKLPPDFPEAFYEFMKEVC